MRLRRLAIACAATIAITGSVVSCGAASGSTNASATAAVPARAIPGGDWTQFGYNAARTGVNPSATGITAGNLHSLRMRTVNLDGTVDSAPIELHGIKVRGRVRDVVAVTTTYGRTIAFDPGSGRKLWEFTPRDIASYEGSPQVTTSSPIFDPDMRWVYAGTPDGLVHKISLFTGRQVRSRFWPVRVTYLPQKEKVTAAFNISGSSLIVTTGGYDGDGQPYQGHIVTIDSASGRLTHVFNSLCSDRHHLIRHPSGCPQSDSAIWGRAGAVVEPVTGRILVATGNAFFNGITDWGDSTLELSPTLRLLHNWTPQNQAQLNQDDADLGSTSPAVLPSVSGYRLAVQGGKAGLLSLLNLDRLDGTTRGAGPRTGGELQDVSTPGSAPMFTAPVVWSHGGRVYLFVADTAGTAEYLVRSGHPPQLAMGWSTGTPGTSPVLAGGLLYVFDGTDGLLNVYQPLSGRRVASLPASGGHWNSPIVVGGRIILPVGDYHTASTSGQVLVYHLPGR